MNGELEKILIKAKKASREMLLVSSEQKNQALKEISKALKNNINVILPYFPYGSQAFQRFF